ncbi:MAG: hypothetical protein FRX49_12786 [Trebouxia sp. A1-2]|nr:MAG: hypothetical protein FRX49_12786 [Trebouxia sp. A1-2]
MVAAHSPEDPDQHCLKGRSSSQRQSFAAPKSKLTWGTAALPVLGLSGLGECLFSTGVTTQMTEHSCEGLLCPIPSTNHQRALLHSQTPQLVLEAARIVSSRLPVVAAPSKHQGPSSTSVAGSVAAKLDSLWLPDVEVCRRQRIERAEQSILVYQTTASDQHQLSLPFSIGDPKEAWDTGCWDETQRFFEMVASVTLTHA